MTPVAYRTVNALGAVRYLNVVEYDNFTLHDQLVDQEIRGLYLSPQEGCPNMAEVYLHSKSNFYTPGHAAGGSCPNDCLSLYLGPVIQELGGVLAMLDRVIKEKVQSLVLRLAKFHWSPQHPSTYTIAHHEHGGQVGLGVIAMRDPASFNLVYAEMNGELDTALKHQRAVTLFAGYESILQDCEQGQLKDNITVMTEEEFREWMQDARNYDGIPAAVVNRVKEAIKLPEVR
jgi:hypothetical protein